MRRREEIIWGLIMLCLLYAAGMIMFTIDAHINAPDIKPPICTTQRECQFGTKGETNGRQSSMHQMSLDR